MPRILPALTRVCQDGDQGACCKILYNDINV